MPSMMTLLNIAFGAQRWGLPILIARRFVRARVRLRLRLRLRVSACACGCVRVRVRAGRRGRSRTCSAAARRNSHLLTCYDFKTVGALMLVCSARPRFLSATRSPPNSASGRDVGGGLRWGCRR